MKQLLCILLSVLLLCAGCALVSCGGDNAGATETGAVEKATKSDSVPIPEPPEPKPEPMALVAPQKDATPVAGECNPEEHEFGAWTAEGTDGSVTRTCEKCKATETLTKEQNIARIYEETPCDRTEFIGYGTPGAAYVEKYEEYFSTLLQFGVTAVVCTDQFSGTKSLGDFLVAAKKTGMDVYADCIGMDGELVADRFMMFEGLTDCIKGMYVLDEPRGDLFVHLAQTVGEYKRRFPDSGLDMAPNLFPSVCDPYPCYKDETPKYTWEEAADAVFEVIGADAVCFDYYPFDQLGRMEYDAVNQYIKNLMQAKFSADKYGKKYWTFLQASELGGHDYTPNNEQLMLETQLSLACGADKMLLYTVFEVPDPFHVFPGMIDKDFNVRPVAYCVKFTTDHINPMKGIYRQFFIDGLICNVDKYGQAVMETRADGYLSITGGYETLLSVETENEYFIGCGKDDGGNVGLYLVNTEYRDSEAVSEYTLHFDGEMPYQVWGADGLEDIGVADSVHLTVDAADAKFIILGREYTE